ncbi:hypothetical protein BDF14DRAFT_1775315 [Spinellus fusiger]|nr:hypothetical protein BDF14DRAFT_1775315 [Spinellus fusiger]
MLPPLDSCSEKDLFPQSPSVLDVLSAAFQAQASVEEVSSTPTPRSPRSHFHSTNHHRPSPLRRHSSSNPSRCRTSYEAPEKPRKRDATSLHRANLVLTATDLHQLTSTGTSTLKDIRHNPYQHHNASSPVILPSMADLHMAPTTADSPPSPTVHCSRRDSLSDRPSLYYATSRPLHSTMSPSSPRKQMLNNHRPSGKVNKRIPALSTALPPHSPSGGVKVFREATALEPSELHHLLQIHPLLIIDIRSLGDYEKSHIGEAINVNLPTLLIKRYRRGAISNFNLENFISTPEGKDYFLAWKQRWMGEDLHEDCPRIVVYDDHMDESDKTSYAWTLVGVLEKCLFIPTQHQGQICWLQGGYEAFKEWEYANVDASTSTPSPSSSPLPPPAAAPPHCPCPVDHEGVESLLPFVGHSALLTAAEQSAMREGYHHHHHPPAPQRSLSHSLFPLPLPMQSRSATTTAATNPNVQRRASLFSLDTSVRSIAKPTPHPHRPPHLTKPFPMPSLSRTDLSCISETLSVPGTPSSRQETPIDMCPTAISGESTPDADSEESFVISEIIPGFLYLGPEITTQEQMRGLHHRTIHHVLNMAEECDDNVPGLKESFTYTKISARDTIEMHNVQSTLKQAVQVIDTAKHRHEPIYVHCKAGKSRSVAVILAYLVLSEHWTLKRAYRHLIKSRPSVSPNIGFVAELMKLEESVHGQTSNFAGTDWHLIDVGHPPSPDTQREMKQLQKAWRARDKSG